MLIQKIQSVIRDVPNFPKKGIVFKDITPILASPELCESLVAEIQGQLKGIEVDAVVGIESRGFLFGVMLANAIGVPFVPVRKAGKLPCKVESHKYDLEYGSAELEIHIDSIEKDWKVVLHDDLLATGGTAVAAAELVQKLGGRVSAFAFVIELEFLKGTEELKKYSGKMISLVKY